MKDQAEKLRQMVQENAQRNQQNRTTLHEPKTRIITVTSGKGGVGKTNFTVNLAISLANLGKNVLIIDADLGMANVDVVLGASSSYNILNLLDEKVLLKDIVSTGPKGIKYMSGGSGIYHLANLSESELQQIISQITFFDEWADITLIDTGAGINRNVLSFVVAADEVVIITTPEPTAITDAYAMMKAYTTHHGTAPLQLVVNRVLEENEGQVVVDKLMKVSSRFLNIPITHLGFIYEDRNMLNAVKKQTPLMLAYPDTLSAQCIDHIAKRLLNANILSPSQGFRGFFHKILQMMR